MSSLGCFAIAFSFCEMLSLNLTNLRFKFFILKGQFSEY